MKVALEFTGRVVVCQIESGECNVCCSPVSKATPNRCPNNHHIGSTYGIVDGRKPFPVVKCTTNGTRCTICGAQIEDFHCTAGHEIDCFYEIR